MFHSRLCTLDSEALYFVRHNESSLKIIEDLPLLKTLGGHVPKREDLRRLLCVRLADAPDDEAEGEESNGQASCGAASQDVFSFDTSTSS
jgi:hypothetical protein